MPGLSGILAHTGLQDAGSALTRLREVQALPGLDLASAEYHDSHCAILHLATGLLPSYPNHCPPLEPVLFVEGEIFSIDGDPVAEGSAADKLLRAFIREPSRCMDGVNGECTVLFYEPRVPRLTIFTDHLSSQSLFYYQDGDCFLFGSEKKAILTLLSKRPAVDEVGLLQLFAQVHNVGARTVIRGLKRLPPGAKAVVQENQLRLERWHTLRFGGQRRQSFDDIVDSAVAEIRAAAARRLGQRRRLVLSLSGGLDSRAVACALPRRSRLVKAVTQSIETGREIEIARRVSNRLGVPHVRLEPGAVPLSRIAPLVAWRTEAEVSLRGGLGTAHHAETAGHGDFIGGGWLGECVSGHAIHPAMLVLKNEHAFFEWCYSYSLIYDWRTLGRVFSADFLARNEAALKDCFRQSWDRAEGPTLIDRFQQWFATNRAIRMTNGSMPVDSHRFEKFRPFYDRQWLETMAALPWMARVGKAFYKAMIYRLGPEVRDIPDSTYGHLVYPSQAKNLVRYAQQMSHRAIGRVRRRLARRTALNAPAEGLFDPALLVRRDVELRVTMESFLNSDSCDRDIFNVAGIEGLLEEHYERGIDHSTLILLLATVHRALDTLVYRQPASPPEEVLACLDENRLRGRAGC